MVVFSVSTRRAAAAALLGCYLLGTAGCLPRARPSAGTLAPMRKPPALVDDGDRASLVAALGESVRYYERLPADRVVSFGATTRTAGEMRASLAALLGYLAGVPSADALAAELGRRFVVYRPEPDGDVLFTGYYLPTVAARREREQHFRVPVLGRPPDLVTAALGDLGAPCACREQVAGRVAGGSMVPYFTRAEIDAGAARGAPVLAWVDDPVGLFFLQVQGSGVLAFPDGTRRTVGFAASNGRPYASIGHVLVARGAFTAEQASMQAIRAWIAAHPADAEGLMHENPRYVFLRALDGPPLGSLGVAVTPGRTIATDPAAFPPGALAFVRLPARGGDPALSRLVTNQDTGAAIRGPARVDVYFGAGADAEATAGRLRANGELYVLVPRRDSTP